MMPCIYVHPSGEVSCQQLQGICRESQDSLRGAQYSSCLQQGWCTGLRKGPAFFTENSDNRLRDDFKPKCNVLRVAKPLPYCAKHIHEMREVA